MKGWPPRFCAACGGRLKAARIDGHARRRCPRCGWVFYGNPIFAVVAAVTRGDRILLTRRARPPHANTWDLPGGFLEADETPEKGLHRELREELGLRIRRARLVTFVTDRYGPRGFPILTAIYHATPAPGDIAPADDVSEARWFRRGALPFKDIAFPSMRRALRAWSNGSLR